MTITRRAAAIGGLGLAAVAGFNFNANAEGVFADFTEGTEDFAIAIEAYTYGYPLVTMEMTRRVLTNVAKPEGTRGPMGQFIRLREYPTAAFRAGVIQVPFTVPAGKPNAGTTGEMVIGKYA